MGPLPYYQGLEKHGLIKLSDTSCIILWCCNCDALGYQHVGGRCLNSPFKGDFSFGDGLGCRDGMFGYVYFNQYKDKWVWNNLKTFAEAEEEGPMYLWIFAWYLS